jgi:hypothetical protein
MGPSPYLEYLPGMLKKEEEEKRRRRREEDLHVTDL